MVYEKWMRRLEDQIRDIGSMQIPVHAAYTCYFLAMSLFPALLLILASLRFTALSAEDLIRGLEGVVPGALMGAAESLIVSTYHNSSGAVLGISAVAALWSSSQGVQGLMTGLNNIYGVQETRSWLATKVLSLMYTFVFLLMILGTLVFQVFGQSLAGQMLASESLMQRLLVYLFGWRYIWMLLIQVLCFSLIYTALPNRRSRFLHSLPGALVAALGWQVFSGAFSLYVELMTDRYTNIYGSVYTVALGLLWVYCCMCILLFGGVLNRMLMQQK